MIRWLAAVGLILLSQFGWGNQSLSAQGWYERMLEKAPNAMYQGIFTHQAGNKMQSVEIIHGSKEGQVWERMLHLDGPSREIIRHGENMFCIHPDKSVEQLPKQESALFGSKNLGGIQQLSKGYEFKIVGKQRVAGRLVVGIQLSPKDAARHYYQLWLDSETTVPLKTELITRTGQVLERYQFNYFKTNGEFDEALFAPRTTGVKLDLAQASSVLKTTPQDVLEWRLNWVPTGFIDQVAKGHAPKMSARRIYSDGIVMFSVYVENVEEIQDEGNAQVGPTALSIQHKQWQGKTHRITVVGEIPGEAAQRIAQSVELL